jgi:hypothetical protein
MWRSIGRQRALAERQRLEKGRLVWPPIVDAKTPIPYDSNSTASISVISHVARHGRSADRSRGPRTFAFACQGEFASGADDRQAEIPYHQVAANAVWPAGFNNFLQVDGA